MEIRLAEVSLSMEDDDVLVKFSGETIISVTDVHGKAREINESKRDFILRQIKKKEALSGKSV